MKENSVRELYQDYIIYVNHITGGNNNFDMFAKKDKDASLFIKCRDSIMISESSSTTKL